jgi:cytoskeletal protein RodZ
MRRVFGKPVWLYVLIALYTTAIALWFGWLFRYVGVAVPIVLGVIVGGIWLATPGVTVEHTTCDATDATVEHTTCDATDVTVEHTTCDATDATVEHTTCDATDATVEHTTCDVTVETQAYKAATAALVAANAAAEAATHAETGCDCVICMSCPRTTVFAPCGHMVACTKCAERLETCPICRTGIGSKLRVIRS